MMMCIEWNEWNEKTKKKEENIQQFVLICVHNKRMWKNQLYEDTKSLCSCSLNAVIAKRADGIKKEQKKYAEISLMFA